MQQYFEKDVHKAFDKYRTERDDLLVLLRLQLPENMDKIATVSRRFQFVDKLTRVKVEGAPLAGNQDEVYWMCDEMFHYGDGEAPRGKMPYQFSIDIILEETKNPFMMVTCDEDSSNYVQEVCTLEKQLSSGRILKSNETWFLQYNQSEIRDGMDICSVEFTGKDYRIAVINPRKSDQA